MRVRIGGTISGSTLTGGTVLESEQFALQDGHAALIGHPGYRGGNWVRLGADGESYRYDKAYNPRFMTLSIAVWDRDASGTITQADRCEQLDFNIDTLMGLLDGLFILERDVMGDTRWIRAQLAAPATAIPGPLFSAYNSAYTILAPLVAPYPFWQSETLHSTVVSGATALANAGNARISNGVFVFSGDGTFTNSDGDEQGNSYAMTVDGSGGAVTVDVYNATVTQGGSPADNTLSAEKPYWMVLGRSGDIATVNVTSTVSVTVAHRDHWF